MSIPGIIIAGAGPAGTATSLFLSKLKIPHTIIDKATFPRDKVCGDALSGKVVHVLNKIDTDLVRSITNNKDQYAGSYGIRFFSPNGKSLDVPFSLTPDKLKYPPGFIAQRTDFDNFLFEKLDRNYAEVLEDTSIKRIERENGHLNIFMTSGQSQSERKVSLIIGAEGDRSVVTRQLTPIRKEDKHYCAGLRVYYENVSGLHEQNFIELHFLKELLPGYLWIFPMPGNRANVGLGMLSSVVSEKKINLKEKLFILLKTHPLLAPRFKAAIQVSEINGWGLPLGSKKRIISGDNFLLTGDAASLIDPFTGEGIGNAMMSGMIAAGQIAEAIKSHRYDKDFLAAYDKEIYHHLWSELKLSHTLQKLAKRAWLFNLVVNKANRNETIRTALTSMFEDLDMRAQLRTPRFYYKVLFG
jgi:menaquinone-9 beta-reductase